MFKLIINDTTYEFESWEDLQVFLYSLDKYNKKRKQKKKALDAIYKVVTYDSFRIVFEWLLYKYLSTSTFANFL